MILMSIPMFLMIRNSFIVLSTCLIAVLVAKLNFFTFLMWFQTGIYKIQGDVYISSVSYSISFFTSCNNNLIQIRCSKSRGKFKQHLIKQVQQPLTILYTEEQNQHLRYIIMLIHWPTLQVQQNDLKRTSIICQFSKINVIIRLLRSHLPTILHGMIWTALTV